MIFSIILLALIWLLPVKGNRVYGQREQSQMLKFLASLIVVIGHQACFYCAPNEVFMRETGLGAFCVSFFLFMSGYGLLYSFVAKQQRLTAGWLKKRMVKLAVPALTAMALFVGVELLVGKAVDWQNLFTYWFVSDINLRYGWYVSEIIVLYFAFWFFYRHFSCRRATVALCLSIGVALAVMMVVKCAIWYVLGLPCFVLGLLLAKRDVENKSCAPKLSGLQTRLLMSIVVIAFWLLKDFDLVQQVLPALNKWRFVLVSKFASNIVFVCVIAYVLMRLPIGSAKIRGGYFYEIYLVQGATLLACREWIENDGWFVVLGMLSTVVVGKAMSVANGWIVKNMS